jgi:hypothetical protein
MHSIRFRSSLIRLLASTTSVVISFIVFFSALAAAQDSPGRFEAGAAFSTMHMPGIAALGPALEGDVNFGRHFALDGAASWFPNSTRGHDWLFWRQSRHTHAAIRFLRQSPARVHDF